MHKIYKCFVYNPLTGVRGACLDISNAFDKLWHEGLVFKLKTYGVDGNLLSWLPTKGCFKWPNFSMAKYFAGVPQGSVIGSLLFLIYTNDIPDRTASICKIFEDDTLLFSKVIDRNNCNIQLNSALEIISKWAFQWKMLFNPDINKQTIGNCFCNRFKKEIIHL